MKKNYNKFVAGAASIATALVLFAPASAFALPDQAAPIAQEKASSDVCSHVHGPDAAHCQAKVIVDGHGAPQTSSFPSGYGPAQFQTGYNLPSLTAGTGQIIGIVDAFDDPTIKSDLDTYSNAFGIPTIPTCAGPISSSAVPCFQKVDQNGGSNYPAVNGGWGLEISLDVEIAHAVCPNCSIALVEATDNSFTNLLTAEDRAFTMGAKEISNSWGGNEFSSEASFDSHFNHPGVAYTVSSGDSGFGAEYPSSSQYVTSVGGTTLNLNADSTYSSESAWSGGGSGCSNYEPRPSFQSSLNTNCSRRATADVSADANPNTGAAVFDSTPDGGQSGWFQVGGTSLSSPLVAAVYALAGGVGVGVQGNTIPYSHSSSLHDITSGSNGRCRRTPVLCNAGFGYDGPTGLGSPNTAAAF